MKQDASLREKFAADQRPDVKKDPVTKCPQTNAALELWISLYTSSNVLLTGDLLRQKWKHYATNFQEDGAEELKPSGGWLNSIKARTGLKQVRRHGEGESMNINDVYLEIARLRELLCNYGPKDIFNMDETGLFYALPPSKGLSTNKNAKGNKAAKTRLTHAFTCNADGSESLKPILIGKALKLRCFKKKTGKKLGFYYRSNHTAWMTSEIFTEWVTDWDQTCQEKGCKIILLVDNFARHVCQRLLKNITIAKFGPNTTSQIQPLDAGITASFKAHYRALFNQRALLKFDTGNSFNSIFTINQLEPMHLADIAWSKVTQVTKVNCFRKTGILLQQESLDVIEEAEGPAQILEESIESLAAGGIFSQAQRPSISDLLNPCHENDTESYTSSWTDEEVVQAVQVSFGVNDRTVPQGSRTSEWKSRV
ncbi:hypothetical protein K3495_g1559 [Podosphaera aphanis]|nr:hypothetical protein K3495_g1559 [Podosphaera aphanis]